MLVPSTKKLLRASGRMAGQQINSVDAETNFTESKKLLNPGSPLATGIRNMKLCLLDCALATANSPMVI